MYLGKLVEYGSTAELLQSPRHPYTQGLIAASPILDPRLRGEKKRLMGGAPGSLIDLPPGAGSRRGARRSCPNAWQMRRQ